MNEIYAAPIKKYANSEIKTLDDLLICEFPLLICLNDITIVILLCTPSAVEFLAIGYLESEGFLSRKDIVTGIDFSLDDKKVNVYIEKSSDEIEHILNKVKSHTTGCGKGTTYCGRFVQCSDMISSNILITPSKILELVDDLQNKSEIFKKTGAAHISMLADTSGNILSCYEDVARHNCLDKIFGDCFYNNISTSDKIVITSGRISSEMTLKCARRGISILISCSAPTSLSVELAVQHGITLIGFARGSNFNIYSGYWRIVI